MNHTFKKNRIPSQGNAIYLITLGLFLLLSYLITIGGLLLLALLLYKIPLSESAVNIGIIVIYILATFFTAFICGKKMQKKKFLWGFILGTSYFLILLAISLTANQSNVILGTNVLTSFMICAGAGTLGGMLA
jgi:putative membrane protein (TIGR04086 family)